ncbi:hypothetical protein [Staphylococcus shinii]|uniref:hypothetical protein n=1 Tax=Staphylococcus shinii TaxID=2912228 RepID=UPI00298EF968|nr:hypothetical protein [Staphylococcus shinii]MDW8563865.1 hypothetical protein [Staphylococcus shinii]
MNLGKRIIKSMEYFDLDNKIQSCIDYVCSSMQEVEGTREWAIKNNEFRLQQEINNAWKSHYVALAILKSIREDNEDMADEILMMVKNKQEKSALSHGDQTEDNTHN